MKFVPIHILLVDYIFNRCETLDTPPHTKTYIYCV